MNFTEAIRSLHLTTAQIAVVIVAGVIALVLGFKIAKLVLKLFFLLFALGCLALGVLWFIARV